MNIPDSWDECFAMERSPVRTRAAAAKRSRVPTVRDSWQAKKSELTRTQVLDATLRCLIKLGYAQTTTEKIVAEAKLSRGAMTHHFKSRAAVFNAAAQHITELRAQEFDQQIAQIDGHTKHLPTLADMKQTMALMQRYYAEPTFIAFSELLRGARTDKGLKRVLLPLEKKLDQKIAKSMLARFPYWAQIEGTREVLTDLVHFTLQGVASDPAQYVDGERLQHLLDLLASIAMREFNAAYPKQSRGS